MSLLVLTKLNETQLDSLFLSESGSQSNPPPSDLYPVSSLFEKIGMRSCAYKDNQGVPCTVVELIGRQKITSDRALAMPCPFATQRMIEPFRTHRRVIGDQQQHCLLEPVHVIAACPTQAFPVLQKRLGSPPLAAAGRAYSPLFFSRSSTARPHCQSEHDACAKSRWPLPSPQGFQGKQQPASSNEVSDWARVVIPPRFEPAGGLTAEV